MLLEISPSTLADSVENHGVVIDVRDESERSSGMIPGSEELGRDFLEMKISQVVSSKDQDIILYCAGGTSSLLAASALHQMGYNKLYSLAGGINAWKAEGRPLYVPPQDSPEFTKRYQKHLILPEIGPQGQRRLASSKVLVVVQEA